MFTQIEGNIYTIPVALVGNPLKELNCYVIKDDERSLVIDTGFRMNECYTALTEGLAELGIDMNRADIFLTHLHADHTGLAPEIATPDTRVYITHEDGGRILYRLRAGFIDTGAEYREQGFPEEELLHLNDAPSMKYTMNKFLSFTYVSDGDELSYGGRRLQVIETPGHTPGHACLYDRENKIMFLGDHVLFNITPNITTWPNFRDPLGHYVHSLMDISIYDVRLPLPGHRAVSGTMAERIGAIIEHHGARIREMLDILDANPGMTPYELSGRMTWRVRGKSSAWSDFPLSQKWFAVGETAAHLEYLLCRGRVKRKFDGRVWHYSTD